MINGVETFKTLARWMSLIVLIVAGALAYQHVSQAYNALPDLAPLTDYRPKIPLRIYTADHTLIGEYGEERRSVLAFKDIPQRARQAVLAAEDDRFYQHSGVDAQSVVRAAINNAMGGQRQGASTITQQLARNFFLTSEQTFRRKFNEALLAFKIEHAMGKDQILEVYMNQIFLGQRAYGFASASHIYFGKPLQKTSLAECAMLAGLPKAPSSFNPIVNPGRARARQVHILKRMKMLGYIDEVQYLSAINERLALAPAARSAEALPAPRAEYVAEMARQFALDKFGPDAYTRGINIVVSIDDKSQAAAYGALRRGVVNYDRAHGYRGPEGFVELTQDKAEARKKISQELSERPDSDELKTAVVTEVSSKMIRAHMGSGEEVEMPLSGLGFGAGFLSKSSGTSQIRCGSVIRMSRGPGGWELAQLPEVSAAFVAIDSHDGRVKALVGGFDFHLNQFNRAAQAWRQPGSAFKPFMYSAALERGFSPQTIINDAPFVFDPGFGAPTWSPKNYDGKNSGPITMRQALTLSKNLVSVRIMDQIGPSYAQDYATRFGFDPRKNPAVLSLALGAGAVTPLQMAAAYAAFANGGWKMEPWVVSKAYDAEGKLLYEAQASSYGREALRSIDERTSFVMDSMLRDVATKGTAAKANASLKRTDLAGKTGTTNDAVDAWFAGYHPDLVGVAWMGFDQPKSLGARETGGGVALPMWIDFMSTVLKDKPMSIKRKVPDGVMEAKGDYYFAEYPPGVAVGGVGLSDSQNDADEEKSESGDRELSQGLSMDAQGNVIEVLRRGPEVLPSRPNPQ